jgi:WS/DGAT/MGAT family acyltransferase
MSNFSYERLSALDTSFLAMEDSNAYMHVAGVSILEAGPLRTEDGGIDFGAIERFTESLLSRIPRYRQKLAWIPFENHPVWIDDPSFNLHYHLRHTSLPKPGSIRQLKRLTARIISQPLDRSKPLWENWIVEGLEGDRFAIIGKAHHCMIDGVAGVDLATIMVSDRPERVEIPEPPTFIPRPTPSSRELFTDEIVRRASLPFQLLRGRVSRNDSGDADSAKRARQAASKKSGTAGAGSGRSPSRSAVRDTLGWALQRPARTPLNAPIGPHRRFDWTAMSLTEAREIGKALGGSMNDVVLATVAGAVRRFFKHRGVNPDPIPFRVLAPVSLRTESDKGELGNRISAWMLDLPIGESDPRERLRRISERTSSLKQENQAAGGEVLMEATEWMPGALFAAAVRAISHQLPFNMVVTNVPGIQRPSYMLGARALESYGVVPLVGNLGLGVAIGSYDEGLYWGFHADWELVPDLHDFVGAIEHSFGQLRDTAELVAPRAAESDAAQATPAQPAGETGQDSSGTPVASAGGSTSAVGDGSSSSDAAVRRNGP